jgi:uncharacterized membrane protein YkvI
MVEILFRMVRLCTMWKPDWLYELMPYIYMVAGISAMLHFDKPVGYWSGAILIVAAILILLMRIENRAFKHVEAINKHSKSITS